MKNYLIVLIILNIFIFISIVFIPANEFIKGGIICGVVTLLIFQYILLKIKIKR